MNAPRRALRTLLPIVGALSLLLIASPGANAGGIGTSRILTGLNQPVYVTHAGDRRLFVVEQPGRIRIARVVNGRWRVTGTFLDIRSLVLDGGERGLLGLAFHPQYASNGRFYVHYTNNSGNHVIAEYRRSSRSRANPASRRVVLTVRDPYSNHNGGWLAFKGPYLYIAFGDGGAGGDPGNRAQRLDTLLGKILRINPLDPDGNGGKRYGIPSSNPFVGRGGRDEIWSYGLRNPWRNSFDRVTGHLWIGDVGQNEYEEVNHVTSGRGTNFGWRLLEGRHRYPSGTRCRSNCRTLPVVEYRHSVGGEDNCSVTGGYVSRRSGAAMYGRYLFADYCSGRIWSMRASGGGLTSINTGLRISSFGEGRNGVIYVVNIGGSIYRIAGT
jgi:glucose/arabinose dehydrogenase